MVLIFVSLIISDVEHFFVYLLAICMSSLEKYLFSSSVHFLIRFFCLFCFFAMELYESLVYLNPYQIYGLQIFFPIL